MNDLVKILLLLLLSFSGKAQDSLIVILPADFDNSSDQVFLGTMNGWLFKAGNDTAWAGNDIEIHSWKKLKPTELSSVYADRNGKLDGWFRIKIKISSDLGNTLFGIKISTWAASDLYVNGNFISSFGSTGLYGKPYRELSPYGNLPVAVNLKPGNEYTIALHVVDYLSPLPPAHLKSEDTGLASLIRITGPAYSAFFLEGLRELSFFTAIWIAVSTVLSLLFWLLYVQNPFEKNLRLIAFGTSFLTLGMFFQSSAQGHIGLTYTGYLFYNFGAVFFIALTSITSPLILINIFKRSAHAGLKIYLAIFFFAFIIAGFLPNSTGNITDFGLFGVLFSISIYYLVSSWKNLKGAQWAIVAGLLSSLTWALIFILTAIYISSNTFLFYLSVTGYSLSFPLSLLVYVAMRFREIIMETRRNAKQIVQLSEEKKEQALNQQKILQEEVNRQTAELRTTLTELKSTQSQLVQSEKMASLGELTAGIAHEIQNPLNFVNNFSEVNTELIVELEQEIDKGHLKEIREIAKDIKENEQKINHHGKRADAIVKSMLQHSRVSTGQKELTDVNALADEYLSLSYQGLRARDRTFNSAIQTDFDSTIGKINIVPQDIGRVLLNLYNNAFYAVEEKKKLTGDGYEPGIKVTTKRAGGNLEIRVRDNGNGIPRKLFDKIFQPFFTTKPAGQGTGLGLSLSYDIMKALGGEITVDTREREFTEFVVRIPLA